MPARAGGSENDSFDATSNEGMDLFAKVTTLTSEEHGYILKTTRHTTA